MLDINLRKFSVIIASYISSVPFFFYFWYFHRVYITPFVFVSQSWIFCFLKFGSLFQLDFDDTADITSETGTLSSSCV